MKHIRICTLLLLLFFTFTNGHAEEYIIAVLPFENLTQKVEFDWIGTGMMSTIITDLNNIKEWTIVDRTRIQECLEELEFSLSAIATAKNQLKIGSFLTANTLVCGDYQINKKQILINARLIDVETNKVHKATRIEGNWETELFNLQKKVAYNLVNNINKYNSQTNQVVGRVTEEVKKKIEQKLSQSNKALEYYAKADHAQLTGNIKQAIQWIEKALAEDADFIGALIKGGILYLKISEHNKALEYIQKALKLASEKGDTEAIFWCYASLGSIYNEQHKVDQGLENLLKAMNIVIDSYGKNDFRLAHLYSQIGYLYENNDDLSNALEYFLKSLFILESHFGKNHHSLVGVYNSIGFTYNREFEFNKALGVLLKANELIRINMEKIKPGDKRINYEYLGTAYKGLKEYDKALFFLFKAIEVSENEIAKNHPDIIWAYKELAGVYKIKTDYDESLRYYLKALSIIDEKLGSQCKETCYFYLDIGKLYFDKGSWERSLEYYLKALGIAQKYFSENHLLILGVYLSVGQVYYKLDNYKKSIEYNLKSVNEIEEKSTVNPSEYLWVYYLLGELYKKTGDKKNARLYKQKARELEENQ